MAVKIYAIEKYLIYVGTIREEMHEAIGREILMSGGPGTIYGAIVHDFIDKFLA